MEFHVDDRVQIKNDSNSIGTVTGTRWTPEEETVTVEQKKTFSYKPNRKNVDRINKELEGMFI